MPNFKFTMQDKHDSDKLRRFLAPCNLEERFLEEAEDNTGRGVESCALLCGEINDAQVMVTHLILPKQSSTHNTVEVIYDASHD